MNILKIWLKIKCLLGFHDWVYNEDNSIRGCLYCIKKEIKLDKRYKKWISEDK